ncbi:MAG: 30S ribosomal protein S27e [Candidatus Undinarchaeales archaeon]|jgi:small subunit ribosomal protein S27e|nr:30S ribosomal protein S27e [Candidatus Undinarchaeales archaeon]
MEPKSKFIKVKCKCGSEQIVFGNASNTVKCINCDAILARPTGGRSNIEAKIVKMME